MFRRSCVRNSYLIKTCQQFPVKIIQESINNVFFNHLGDNCKEREMRIIENLEKFEEATRVSYGKSGVENLVSLSFQCQFDSWTRVFLKIF